MPPKPLNPLAERQGWTLVLLSIGIGLIACCVLIPQAEQNRRLYWETEKLRADLDHLKKQVEVNEEFVRRVGEDPALSERLAQRQMKFIRKGSNVLELKSADDLDSRSPFLMTTVPVPPATPEYRPMGGVVARMTRDPKIRLYMIGGGLMLLAMGLVLGHTPPKAR